MIRSAVVTAVVLTLLIGTILAAGAHEHQAPPAEAAAAETAPLGALPPGYLPLRKASDTPQDAAEVAGKCDKCPKHADGEHTHKHAAGDAEEPQQAHEHQGRRTMSCH